MTRLIAVASGKGGVGKTTTVVNLAAALAQFDKNVIIVDANLTTANVGIHLGLSPKLKTLQDVIAKKASLADAIYLHPSGFRVIPAGIHLKHLKTSIPHRVWDVVLDLFGSSEIVLLDTPAGLEKGAHAVLDASEEVIIVATPDQASLTDALKTVRVAQKSGSQVLGVALNKIRNERTEMKNHHVEETLEIPVLAKIPHDDNVRKALHKKTPVVLKHPNSPASVAYKKLAADLIGVDYELPAEGWNVMRVLGKIFGI